MAQKNLESNEALDSALRTANTDLAEKIVEVLPGELTADVTDVLTSVQQTLAPIPFAYTGIALGLLALGAWVSNWITKFILFRVLARLFKQTGVIHRGSDTAMGVVARLSNVVPALVITAGLLVVPGLPDGLVKVIQNVCAAFIVLTVAMAISGGLDLANRVYSRRSEARLRPIKGYLQVVKIVLYAIATVLMIASLIDRSPLILLSGLGAMAAVMMLIFQDTLLSLVASVQIGSGNIVRVGDWIELPGSGIEGDVTDIALHTVTIQGSDKTITTLPVRKLISDPVRNWSGMVESGGRRIKRRLLIDVTSIRFLTGAELDRLGRSSLLAAWLRDKRLELDTWNRTVVQEADDRLEQRRLTNIGTFRAYVLAYLRKHSGIHQDMTLLVRQNESTPDGLPLELIAFANTTAWIAYENIQSDIFDHLIAVLPEFGLRLFQNPSGTDMSNLAHALDDDADEAPTEPAAAPVGAATGPA